MVNQEERKKKNYFKKFVIFLIYFLIGVPAFYYLFSFSKIIIIEPIIDNLVDRKVEKTIEEDNLNYIVKSSNMKCDFFERNELYGYLDDSNESKTLWCDTLCFEKDFHHYECIYNKLMCYCLK